MDSYLADLIARMNDVPAKHQAGYSSANSISGLAHDEARGLRAAAFVAQLRDYVGSERNAKRRSSAYFILGRLAFNLKGVEPLHVIAERLGAEDNKYVLYHMLVSIHAADIHYTRHVEPIVALTSHREALVRHAALRALVKQASGQPQPAQCIQRILETSGDEWDLHAAAYAAQPGYRDCVPGLLRILAEFNARDLCFVAVGALAAIAGPTQLDTYLKVLSAKRDASIKAAATAALRQHGDERAIDAIISRVRAILAKPRKRHVIAVGELQPELVDALAFLQRFEGSDPRILPLFDWVVSKKRALLAPDELAWVAAHLNAARA
jgi:hypothetical protein